MASLPRSSDAPPPPPLRPPNEATALEEVLDGRDATIAFEGSADPLVKFLARYDVRALRSRDDDLEDIFLGYYRG